MRLPTALTALAAAALAANPALAQDFVYQGKLSDNTQPADGIYDLTFEYYTTISGGAVLQTATRDNVQVTDGVFQVSLPMPPSDNARFLELAVRDGASTGGYTQLLPRTFIASTPYATKALNVEWDRNTSNYLTFGDGDDIVLINRENRIGSEYFGVGANTSSFGGMYISTASASGRPFYGYAPDGLGSSVAYHYLQGSTGSLIFNIGNFDRFSMNADGSLEVQAEVTADNFEYQSPQSRFLTVAGNTFSPGNNVPYLAFTNNGAGLYPTEPRFAWYLAPVNLPDGAIVTSFRGYLYDNNSSTSVSVSLRRVNLNLTSSTNTLAFVETTSTSTSTAPRVIDDPGISFPVADNSTYAYFLFAEFINPSGNSDARVAGARITYTVSQPD